MRFNLGDKVKSKMEQIDYAEVVYVDRFYKYMKLKCKDGTVCTVPNPNRYFEIVEE